MGDPHVCVTLTLRTDSPPSAVATEIMQAVVAHVPHQLSSVNWQGFDIDEEDETDE